jgi:hypothetical protein
MDLPVPVFQKCNGRRAPRLDTLVGVESLLSLLTVSTGISASGALRISVFLAVCMPERLRVNAQTPTKVRG